MVGWVQNQVYIEDMIHSDMISAFWTLSLHTLSLFLFDQHVFQGLAGITNNIFCALPKQCGLTRMTVSLMSNSVLPFQMC